MAPQPCFVSLSVNCSHSRALPLTHPQSHPPPSHSLTHSFTTPISLTNLTRQSHSPRPSHLPSHPSHLSPRIIDSSPPICHLSHCRLRHDTTVHPPVPLIQLQPLGSAQQHSPTGCPPAALSPPTPAPLSAPSAPPSSPNVWPRRLNASLDNASSFPPTLVVPRRSAVRTTTTTDDIEDSSTPHEHTPGIHLHLLACCASSHASPVIDSRHTPSQPASQPAPLDYDDDDDDKSSINGTDITRAPAPPPRPG